MVTYQYLPHFLLTELENSSKLFESLFDVGLWWEAMCRFTGCDLMDVCLGRRRGMQGVQGDPSPHSLICLNSSWNSSPFDVGNQLIISKNWLERLGTSVKALFSNCLYFDLRNFRTVFPGISGTRERLRRCPPPQQWP